ncbi:MAG TPA: 50S ribosomal protein L11 methyltransferase [Hyphomonadaceae bacterium]|jgi:ribosomal protein L11 methyltransferase|nr:50S ribosomal protein L11 methyltransferase [Hyphomonadaceae bacterium]HPI47705.1 50S ribosomal protein L11 methyltransferase [Hyphomonadaceae bacterium]
MYRVHCLLPRADAERLSDILTDMDPSPASAVSVEEASKVSWSLDAFCTDEDLAKQAAAVIEREIPSARAAVQKLDDKDWVAVSLAGLPAVHAGPFVVAGWHELAHLEGGKIPVWIEAGPAFGTGHHGTTKGCLEALAIELKRKRPLRVLDVGTGSGVLALAAVKYGAGFALGTDMDKESIRIAKENAKNNTAGRRLKLMHARGTGHRMIRAHAPYDLVLANILARPLVSLAPEIARMVARGGRVILSGLLTHQEPQVRAAYAGQGLTLVNRRRLNGWSTLVYARQNHSGTTL